MRTGIVLSLSSSVLLLALTARLAARSRGTSPDDSNRVVHTRVTPAAPQTLRTLCLPPSRLRTEYEKQPTLLRCTAVFRVVPPTKSFAFSPSIHLRRPACSRGLQTPQCLPRGRSLRLFTLLNFPFPSGISPRHQESFQPTELPETRDPSCTFMIPWSCRTPCNLKLASLKLGCRHRAHTHTLTPRTSISTKETTAAIARTFRIRVIAAIDEGGGGGSQRVFTLAYNVQQPPSAAYFSRPMVAWPVHPAGGPVTVGARPRAGRHAHTHPREASRL